MGALRAFAIVVLAFAVTSAYLGIHQVRVVNWLCWPNQVPEGHIGLYWFGGKLLGLYLLARFWPEADETTEPGLHTMVPYLTRHANIQITLQTDTVTDIPCGTSGGSMIYFDKIEVVNILKKEKAHETVK